jgi:hypothetical protein
MQALTELSVDLPVVNPPALDAALRAALGDRITGLSTGRGVVHVHFVGPATADEQARAREIIAAHDPDALTDAQRAAAERLALLADLEAQVQAMDLTRPLSAEEADLVARYNALRGLLGR